MSGPTALGTGSRGLVRALLPGVEPAASESGRRRQLIERLVNPGHREVWLILSVLGRSLPSSDEVLAASRLVRHEGLQSIFPLARRQRLRPSQWLIPAFEVVADAVLVDIHDSARSTLMTGVQRVARSIATEWMSRPDAVLVGWSTRGTQLHRIRPERFAARSSRGLFVRRPIIPCGGHFVLTELVTEPERSARTQAIASFAGVRSTFVANDAIPLTTAETTGAGMPGVFAKYLAAVSRFDRAACISRAASVEYEGWRVMLRSAGLSGPALSVVPLPIAAGTVDASAETEARSLLLTPGMPMVLAVGSHEPRKNHEAILHASEILWREGIEFSLVFVGGNSWNSAEFELRVTELQRAGRPISTHSGLPERLLWWAYRLAHFTVFPSLNEGFGLPVAESLACGVPAVTSNFGSMAEIASSGGCVLVDPRDDESIASGMRTLLADPTIRAQLSAEAYSRIESGWERYADELWRVAVA